MLQLSNVSFQYKKKPVLQDLSFSFPIGQIIGLVGENGSGKSTLMKVLAGLLRPTAGEITLEGKPVTRRSADKIAYLPDTDLFLSTTQVNSFSSIMLRNLKISPMIKPVSSHNFYR